MTSGDGLARLDVPANALTATVAIDLRPSNAVPLDPAAVRSAAYEITPASLTFQSAARLALTYAPSLRPSGTPEGDLRVHRLENGQWTLGAGEHGVDTTARTAATTITTGGTYGVRWRGPTAPCNRAEDRQFDFWLGEWTFNQTVPSVSGGVNSITRDATNCLILENFNNGLGRSISLFSRLDGQWHQTYIDTSGYRLVIAGKLEGGRMVLYQTPNGRALWERLSATQVRFWQETSTDRVNWTVTLDSRYVAR